MGLFDKFKRKENAPQEMLSEQATKTAKIDLTKKINLAKDEVKKVVLTKPVLNGLKAKVGLVLDFSGSMGALYLNGTVQSVIEKILPLAMTFDDDGSMETWIFSSGSNAYHRLPDVTLNNLEGYASDIYSKYSMGGTEYAPVMKNVTETYENSKLPAYVLFITDGDNSDKRETDSVIKNASRKPVFWQFVGIGNRGSFGYLQKLDDMSGRYVDNADFFAVNDVNTITYNQLLDEFPSWLINEKVKEMLR